MAEGQVRFRLIRTDDAPPSNPAGEAFEFGLQDAGQQLVAAQRLADGRLAWDFALTVKVKPDGSPNFLGRFASGPADDRFVYLAWRSIARGIWINRVKARLSGIGWPLIQAAQAEDRPLVADLTGWSPHDGRKQVSWTLGAD